MTGTGYYATEMACQALSLAQTGASYSKAPTHCAMCRRPVERGCIAASLDMPRSFQDHVFLSPTGVVCGYCNTMCKQDVLRAVQRVVVTSTGLYPIGTDENRAWAWLTPPEPPFAVVINHSTMGAYHYIWRTPVSMSKDVIVAMVDGRLRQIKRPSLLQAIDDSRVVTDALNVRASAVSRKGKVFSHCWQVPSREGTHPGHGRLVSDVEALLAVPELRDVIARLNSLDDGVLLAMASIVKKKGVTPTAPQPITSLKDAVKEDAV